MKPTTILAIAAIGLLLLGRGCMYWQSYDACIDEGHVAAFCRGVIN